MAVPPTDTELRAIEQFRQLLVDLTLSQEQSSNMFLLAWLRARDMDILKANEMLRKSLEWRTQNDICNVLNWKRPESFPEKFPYDIYGHTDYGCPVLVVPFGKWDVRKAVESGQREDWLKYIDYLLAEAEMEMKGKSQNSQDPVTQFVAIVNFDDFSMRQLASFTNLHTILEFVRRFESNYPETLNTAYVVNASRVFTMLFRLVKPLLSARTLGKVQIYGANQKQWKRILAENIPEDQLPVEYGGRIGKKLSVHSLSTAADEVDFKKIDIQPGQRFTIDFDVHHLQTVLSWRFKTNDFDIGFCIIFNDVEEIRSLQKLDSHVHEQLGLICCEKIGKYSFIFDNSHSRFRGKTLHYWTETTSPAN